MVAGLPQALERGVRFEFDVEHAGLQDVVDLADAMEGVMGRLAHVVEMDAARVAEVQADRRDAHVRERLDAAAEAAEAAAVDAPAVVPWVVPDDYPC